MLLVEQFAAVALNVADYGYVMRHHSESATCLERSVHRLSACFRNRETRMRRHSTIIQPHPASTRRPSFITHMDAVIGAFLNRALCAIPNGIAGFVRIRYVYMLGKMRSRRSESLHYGHGDPMQKCKRQQAGLYRFIY